MCFYLWSGRESYDDNTHVISTSLKNKIISFALKLLLIRGIQRDKAIGDKLLCIPYNLQVKSTNIINKSPLSNKGCYNDLLLFPNFSFIGGWDTFYNTYNTKKVIWHGSCFNEVQYDRPSRFPPKSFLLFFWRQIIRDKLK